jgi:hypothetical protein
MRECQKTCVVCGVGFIGRSNSRYCRDCIEKDVHLRSYYKHHAARIEKRARFRQKKKDIRRDALAKLPELLRTKGNKPRKGRVVTCKGCFVEFYASPSRDNAEFCSRGCANRVKKTNKPLICAWCGDEFYVSASQQRLRNRVCCSNSCHGFFFAARGDKNKLWRGGTSKINTVIRQSPGGQAWRKSVFGRDDFTCQKCHKRGGYIQAHHIKPFSKFPELRFDISNGITLCKACHRDVHAAKNNSG